MSDPSPITDPSPTNKNTNPRPPLKPIPNHPLAPIVGKYKGEFWEETLAEIQRARQADREYWQQVIEQQDAG